MIGRKPYNPYPNRVTLSLDRDLTDDEWQRLWSLRTASILLSPRECEEEEKMKKAFKAEGYEPLSLEEIVDCVRDALRRLSILVNPLSANKSLILRMTDKQLAQRNKSAPSNERDHKLFAIDFLSVDPSRSEREEASRCFYNTLRLIREANSFEKIDFELTRPFLTYLYIGQDPPSPKLTTDLDISRKRDTLRESTVIYVARNLLHNLVHIREGINDSNYHDFAGKHRETSDFLADNGSWFLLLKAYGVTPITNGEITDQEKTKINRLFTLVRSNRLFVLRSKFRDREEEKVWRMRRSIANEISKGLIIEGRTPTSVKVFIDNDDCRFPNGELQFNHASASINEFNFPQLDTRGIFSWERSEQIAFISRHFISSVISRSQNDQRYAEYFETYLNSKIQLLGI